MMIYPNRAVTEIQAPSDAAECSRLRRIVARIAENKLCSKIAAADIEIVLGEALSNAVKYGDNESKVQLRVQSPSRSTLSIELAYSGKEFDTSVKYPREPNSGNGGFGRWMMKQLTDSMEYSFKDGMTTLRLIKRR